MEYQLTHYDSLQKFEGMQWPILFFILDGVRYPDNIAHFIRVTNSLWWNKIVIWWTDYLNIKKIESIAKSYNTKAINIIMIDSVLEYIVQNKRTENYICVELTNKSDLYYLKEYDFSKPIWIIMWGERHWISDAVLNNVSDAVHLPMLGSNSSMNVSHAWVVVAYDIFRKYRR